jgi:hypothetical protein
MCPTSAFTAWTGWLLAAALVAGSPSAEEPRAALSPWQAYLRKMAVDYDMVLQSDPPRSLTLHEEPVMKWAQPARGGDEGAVMLWLDRGRPAAIGTFFIWPTGDGTQSVTHELHLLSQQPLIGTWNTRRWMPPEKSIEWKQVPEGPAPIENDRQRQLQLRRVSRRFSGGSRNRQGETWTLRLLPQPLFSYEALPETDVAAGAVFGLVQGTDLEAVLLIERTTGTDHSPWRYACARMSDLKLTVSLDDTPVWNADFASYDTSSAPYCCATVEKHREPPAP